ncbi:hypothetical protein [Catenuloplanes japonicus]|uniref:hypothetical protein n=1 Tax=Catenuloplanes japonicus TaxID=33876 RepID=UPI0005278BC5|nr:hypothetical protein [Catenuloplanes japonicus]
MSRLGTNTNVADGAATVALQAGVVHDGVHIYEAPPGATPADRFEVGLRYLEGGVASKAQELIEEAMAAGHRTSRVRFYWILALLSGRTLSQLTDADEDRLRHALGSPRLSADDEWVEGLRVIERFLTALDSPKDDPQTAIKAFDALPPARRKEILRHLELFLKDKIQDAMWQRSLAQAKREQKSSHRRNRVWIFFQPTPAPPRAGVPAPVATTLPHHLLAWAASAVFLAAVGYLGLLVLTHGSVWAVLAFLAGVGGLVLIARYGAPWRYRVARRHTMSPAVPPAPESDFARDLDRMLWQYAGRFAPDGADASAWQARSARIRTDLATAFQGAEPHPREIAWLVRHRLRDARDRWADDSMPGALRAELRTPWAERLWMLAGAALLLAAVVWALPAPLTAQPLHGVAAVMVALLAGHVAVRNHLQVFIERRRYAAELAEAEDRLHGDLEAYAAWQEKLSLRPTDAEMASWLDCDRRILLDQAMRHHGLTPRHVIASAFIGGSGGGAQRARIRRGPWRYSQYRLTVFLLTADGVRQMTADLDFAQGEMQIRKRTNYRYEAVASVHVTEAGGAQPRFKLTLVNGEAIDVRVTGGDLGLPDLRADSSVAEAVSLDSTGLKNALQVLEGIAAEGKRWVHLDRERRGSRVSVLRKAIEALIR